MVSFHFIVCLIGLVYHFYLLCCKFDVFYRIVPEPYGLVEIPLVDGACWFIGQPWMILGFCFVLYHLCLLLSKSQVHNYDRALFMMLW